MMQEIEERAEPIPSTILDWEDITSYIDSLEDEESRNNAPDPAEIDSPEERRLQIAGFKIELEHAWREAEKAELLLGRGELGEFSIPLQPVPPNPGPNPNQAGRNLKRNYAQGPEFSPNKKRNKPQAEQVKMNHILGLDGADLIFGAIEAY
ncbi:hypothetical protein NUW58_g10104 [Xylaria curta]|uniref:Uncharacterized protein n=1 Tax=Xylaria curta TaxID=42375 RepID=A0ACC1MPR9_9PEZI|nr:hypothetical protein NUW58_g10104 [Xylaria curta]